MTAMPEAARARRYLLGLVSDDESAALEQEYFERPDALDRIAAAEDDLIEDYLAGELSASDRDRFEGAYLSAPQHRVRVETVRRLMTRASRSAPAAPQKILAFLPRRFTGYGTWLALAASILVVASIALWVFAPFGGRPADVAGNRTPEAQVAPAPGTPAAAPSAARILALALSPVAVRGASESPAAAIPANAEVVAINLESDGDNRNLTARRASIRTVGGRDVWQGAVASTSGLPPGAVARVEVPAATLAPDDYVITLFGADRAGREVEWTQYFLRVRGR